jgi:hypothetical protein
MKRFRREEKATLSGGGKSRWLRGKVRNLTGIKTRSRLRKCGGRCGHNAWDVALSVRRAHETRVDGGAEFPSLRLEFSALTP